MSATRMWLETGPAAPDVRSDWPPALLREPVRIARTGSADRVDRLDGRARESWADHVSHVGLRAPGGLWLIDALEEAALTGHGGGHFPVARKWRSLLGVSRDITVVANGSESEPLSAKDATLLRQRPHLVLDGMHCAIESVGARQGVVWLHESDRYTRRVVEEAILERRLGGATEAVTTVVAGPNTYLAGESSAIIRGLAGGPVLPTYRGVRAPSSNRTERSATLVHNVETLARVAITARECGFDDSRPRLECFAPGPGSTLLTVLTRIDRQVIELPRSSTLQDILTPSTWPTALPPSTALLGGFGGMWARWADVSGLEANETAMRSAGRTLGAGIVAPLTENLCGVAETARIVGYLAASSARQCGPCMFGLPALADSLELLRTGSARRGELRRMAADLESVRGRGACHHPDGATRLVASAWETFGADFARHAKRSPCAFAGSQVIPVPEVS